MSIRLTYVKQTASDPSAERNLILKDGKVIAEVVHNDMEWEEFEKNTKESIATTRTVSCWTLLSRYSRHPRMAATWRTLTGRRFKGFTPAFASSIYSLSPSSLYRP